MTTRHAYIDTELGGMLLAARRCADRDIFRGSEVPACRRRHRRCFDRRGSPARAGRHRDVRLPCRMSATRSTCRSHPRATSSRSACGRSSAYSLRRETVTYGAIADELGAGFAARRPVGRAQPAQRDRAVPPPGARRRRLAHGYASARPQARCSRSKSSTRPRPVACSSSPLG